jgi:4-hydroxy 2-oxovalerate aldolase
VSLSQTIPQILDVTLRDGGYVNDWQFPIPNALAIVSTLAKGGMPYIEVGYYHPPHSSNNGSGHLSGPSAYCQHEYLEAVSRVRGNSKLGVMVHLNDVLPTDYTFLAEHDISTVRFVVPGSNIQQLEPHIDAARAAGLNVSVNLIRASQRSDENILLCARAAQDLGADWLYLADSNGSLFPDRVERIFRELREELDIRLGFHAHDSLHLAFANSLAAIRGGATLLDSSLAGMGKGAGNLVTELICSYFKTFYEAEFTIGEFTTIARKALSEWIRADHVSRCESTLSALLDLNADKLKQKVAAAKQAQRPLLLELEADLEAQFMSAGHGWTRAAFVTATTKP